ALKRWAIIIRSASRTTTKLLLQQSLSSRPAGRSRGFCLQSFHHATVRIQITDQTRPYAAAATARSITRVRLAAYPTTTKKRTAQVALCIPAIDGNLVR